jgi:hypothetical protein
MKVAPIPASEAEAFLDGFYEERLERAARACRTALLSAETLSHAARTRGLHLEQCRAELERLDGQVARMKATMEAHERRTAEALKAIDAAPEHRRSLLTSPSLDHPDEPHVYFIIEDSGDYLKIGFSAARAGNRRADLQVANPRELIVVATLQGDRSLETRLHRAFREEHQRGEWFRVSERLAAFVLEVRAGHDVDWYLKGAA